MTQCEGYPKRFSRSLNNLNLHPQFLEARPGRSTECIALRHLVPPPAQTMTILDQTPLWTALTITAHIPHPDEDSW